MTNFIAKNDPDVWSAIASEIERQSDGLELIASENYTSPAVMQAAGSVLTNKYAEGYPGKRYYGGCQYVDVVEQLAIDRAKQLFGAEFANVQPHSGSQANTAIYLAALEPGGARDGLDRGGHVDRRLQPRRRAGPARGGAAGQPPEVGAGLERLRPAAHA